MSSGDTASRGSKPPSSRSQATRPIVLRCPPSAGADATQNEREHAVPNHPDHQPPTLDPRPIGHRRGRSGPSGRTAAPPGRGRRWRRFAALAALVAGTVAEVAPIAAPPSAEAADSCTIVWDGGAGTASWLDAANWTDDRLPTWTDDACIYAASAPTNGVVVSGASNQIVNSLSADINLRVAMDPAAGFRMIAGSYLHDLYVDSGYVEVDTELRTWSVVHTGGDIGGPGAMTVNGEYHWTGGRMYGTGWTELTGTPQVYGLFVEGAGKHDIDRRTLVVDHGFRWQQGAELHLTSGATVRTFGESIVEAPGATIDGAGFLDNRGGITVAPNADVDIDAQYLAIDGAWLDVQADAVVHLGTDTSIDGDLVVEPDGVLDIDADADIQLSALSELRGAGELSISHDFGQLIAKGNIDVDFATVAPGTLTIDGTTKIGNLEIDGGQVIASAGRTVDVGDFAIFDGAAFGTFHVTGNAELGGGKVASQGATTFRVDGTATVDGPFRSEDTVLSLGTLRVIPAWEDGVVPGVVLAGEGARITVDGTATSSLDTTIQAGTVGGRTTVASFQAHDLQITGGVLTVDVPMTVGPTDSVTVTDGAQLTVSHLVHDGAMDIAGTVLVTKSADISGDMTTDGESSITFDEDANVTLHESAALGGAQASIDLVGFLHGAGTLSGTVSNLGGIAPEPTIDILGSYTQDADARLWLEANGDHLSALNVTGSAEIAGTAWFTPEDGGEAPRGELPFFTATGGYTGTFQLGGDLEGCGDVRYDAHAVVLVVQPCIVVTSAEASEGDEQLDFHVSLSVPATSPVEIHYGVVPGTADITDYVDEPGTLTIPAGATSGTITVGIVDDDDEEQDETFTLSLGVTGGQLENAEAIGTILDDDVKLDLDYQSIPVIGGIQYITGLGTEYVLGVSSPDADTDINWVYRISTDEFGQTKRGFMPAGMNDFDLAVGTCGSSPCMRDHGVDTMLDTGGYNGVYPRAISNDGEIVGYRYTGTSLNTTPVRWASAMSPMEDIAGLPGDSVKAEEVNVAGVIAGTTRIGTEEHAWVMMPDGTVTDLGFLPGMGDASIGGIAEDGTVAGGMTPPYNPDNPYEVNFHGFTWTPETGLTDLGPETWVWDINSDGDMVGMIGARAALWRGDRVIDVNKAMGFGSQSPSGITLVEARKINDQGTIVVVGSYRGYETHGVLVPQGGACRVCLDAHVWEPEFPNPDHQIDAGDEIVEGNPAELGATIRNNDPTARTVTIDFIGPDGQPMTDRRTITLAPHAEQYTYVPWQTEGLAWKDGVDRGPVDLKIEMRDVSGQLITSFPIRIRVVPRPIVNVHGMNSDASTWAAYPAFAAGAHAGWKAFAVDTMNTKPWIPNTIAQNAALLDTYVQKIQREQNAWQVDLVAHSMGGLISRYYIQNLMTETGGLRAAHQLVMLGTPNAGSPCADIFSIPMTAELRTDMMRAFNTVVTDHRGVPFSIAAGDPVTTTCGVPGLGDIVVPLDSALTLGIDAQVFPILHTDMTASGQLFTDFVLPRLDGQHPVAALASSRTLATAGIRGVEAAAATLDAAASPADAAPVLHRDRGTIQPGATDSFPLQLPEGLTTVGITAVASPSLEIAIVKAGTVVATTGTDPAFGADFRTLTLDAPAAGSYTVRLINHGTAPMDVTSAAWAQGDRTKIVAEVAQVSITGKIRIAAHLEGDALSRPVSYLMAEVFDRTGQPISGTLLDDGANGDALAGDGIFTAVFTSIATGPVVVDVSTDVPGFYRVVSAAIVVKAGADGPGNDAPVAMPAAVTVRSGETNRIDLDAADPEGSPLGWEIVTQPAHGKIGGSGPMFDYLPTKGYMGPDSFTYRVFDGELWSQTVTVSITVGRARSEIVYHQPLPAKVTTNATMHVYVTIRGLSFEPVPGGTVTITLGSRTVTTEVGSGSGAEADVLADLPGGRYPMTISFSGNDKYEPSTYTQMVDVFEGVAPVPSLQPINGEAGYAVRFWANAGDNDGDAIRYQFDFEDDGVFDAEVGVVQYGVARVDHVFDAPFTGTTRVRVTDGAGHVVDATAPITIAPHRELGALHRILVEGEPVQGVDISDDGRYLLYRVVDTEDQQSLPTPFGVLDLTTGEHEPVSILPDGTPVQFPATAVLSPDGRTVAFSGEDYVNGFLSPQTYIRNLDTDTTVRASMTSTGAKTARGAFPLAVTDGGTKVIFESVTEDLVNFDLRDCGTLPHAAAPCEQLYLRDMTAGTTTLMSRPTGDLAANIESWPGMSANGRYVAYTSWGAMWLVDTTAGTWERLPIAFDGEDGNRYGTGQEISISDDGRYVTFTSEATNLSPLDTQYSQDVYRFDRQTSTTSVVSLNTGGTAAQRSQGGTIDRCAARTVFASETGDIVAGDTNERWDIFVRDADGSIRRISVEARDGTQSNGDSNVKPLQLSGNGRWVLFNSDANNLVPGDIEGFADAFLLDLGTATWSPVNGCGSAQPPVNHAPTAAPVAITTDEDTAAAVALSGEDADGDDLTFAVVDGPAHGSLSGEGSSLVYTPEANWSGTDSFTYTVSDGVLTSAAATVTITVRPVNDAPTAGSVTTSTDEDTSVAVSLVGADAEDDVLSFAVVDGPAHGSLSGSGASLTYAPAANWSGTDSFTYTVSDGALTSAAATVTITVRPVNDAPTATISGPATLAEGTTGALTVSAVDVDGDVLTYTWTTSGGSILPNGAGTGATLNAGDGPATRRVTVTVSDGTTTATAATDVAVTNVAPTVTITTPASNPSTTTGAAVAFTAAVSDQGGDAVTCSISWGDSTAASSGCSASHTWTAAGTFTVRVTAIDDDGASSSATRTVTVTTAAWPWQGFFAPVSNPPAVNMIEAGSTVPVKFSLGGDRGMAIFAAGYPATYSHPCSGSGPNGALQPIDPSSLKLTYDRGSKRYQFQWRTTKAMAGTCRTLVVKLADGSVHTAEFRFRTNGGGGGCGGHSASDDRW